MLIRKEFKKVPFIDLEENLSYSYSVYIQKRALGIRSMVREAMQYLAGYRSGHNGADLKSAVSAQTRLGSSNLSPAAIK